MEQIRQEPEVTSSAAGNHAAAPPRGHNVGCHTPKAASCLHCHMLSADAPPATNDPRSTPLLATSVRPSQRHRHPRDYRRRRTAASTKGTEAHCRTCRHHRRRSTEARRWSRRLAYPDGKPSATGDQPKWPRLIRRRPRQ
jgi:hypothetical protein